MNDQSKKRNLVIIPDLPKVTGYERWLKTSRIRGWIWNAEPRMDARGRTVEPNGFKQCIVRVGSTVLIDVDSFYAWLSRHPEQHGGE